MYSPKLKKITKNPFILLASIEKFDKTPGEAIKKLKNEKTLSFDECVLLNFQIKENFFTAFTKFRGF